MYFFNDVIILLASKNSKTKNKNFKNDMFISSIR